MTHFILDTVLPILLSYKYLALFLLTLLSASILPIPPGTIIMASAGLAYQGYFKLEWVIVSAILGKVLGDSLSYFLARKYGYKVFSKLGFKHLLESQKFKNLRKKIKTHSTLFLFLSRFEISMNLILNIISGISKINYKKFILLTTLGEITQIIIYASIGYFFGSQWKLISSLLSGGIMLVIIILIIIYFIYKKNKTES